MSIVGERHNYDDMGMMIWVNNDNGIWIILWWGDWGIVQEVGCRWTQLYSDVWNGSCDDISNEMTMMYDDNDIGWRLYQGGDWAVMSELQCRGDGGWGLCE
jgi:hypothetical protein